jgi:hypothetical protein
MLEMAIGVLLCPACDLLCVFAPLISHQEVHLPAEAPSGRMSASSSFRTCIMSGFRFFYYPVFLLLFLIFTGRSCHERS